MVGLAALVAALATGCGGSSGTTAHAGVAPHVIDSAVVENTDTTDGGRVLKVVGQTASGQRYVSKVFVTAATGTPKASVGVYWSGLGLGDSPFGENKTVVPQSECGRK